MNEQVKLSPMQHTMMAVSATSVVNIPTMTYYLTRNEVAMWDMALTIFIVAFWCNIMIYWIYGKDA